MTETFEETLKRVISHQSDLKDMEERGIESSVVVPLLRQAGWNEFDFTEIYPQWPLPKNKRVDYNLRISGRSKIFVEVKQWDDPLDGWEKQLEEYCRLATPKPKLGVLTSGKVWRLYLSPTASRGQNSHLRKFLEFDIISAPLEKVESDFRLFLTRDGMVNPKGVTDKAGELNRDLEGFRQFKNTFTNALREAASNEAALQELILAVAEHKDISINDTNVKKLIEELNGSIKIEITKTTRSLNRPASYTLITKPDGTSKKHNLANTNGWRYMLVEFCELMQELHPEKFRGNILSMPKRFSENVDAYKYTLQVSNSGIYANVSGSSQNFKEDCYNVAAKFGYPKESFVIRDKSGAQL